MDESSVVKRFALVLLPCIGVNQIRNMNMLGATDHSIAKSGDGINSIQTVLQSKGLQCIDASGLQKLSHDTIGLAQVSLYKH